MTVGIAVLAERARDAARQGTGARAIVLVADKQLTWSKDEFRSDVDVEKYRGLPGRWCFLFAGNTSTADDVSDEARRLGVGQFSTGSATRKAMKLAYQSVRAVAYEDQVMKPLRPAGEFFQGRAKELPDVLKYEWLKSHWEFSETFACDLLVAGFHGRRGQIFEVTDPGVLDRDYMSCFRVIGAPEDVIRTRLMQWRARHSDSLHRALYHALRAKFHAELSAPVGQGTDAWIITASNATSPKKVDDWVIDLIRARAIQEDSLPLYRLPPDADINYTVRPLQDDWEEQIKKYVARIKR